MDISRYEKYITGETMMGPNSARILLELLERFPLRLSPEDTVLDLGCGKGLTSLVLARETGAKVAANDLWVSADENGERFAGWGVGGQVTPVRGDAGALCFEEKRFAAVVSVDSYHYFAGQEGFFRERLLPFVKDGGVVLIGIPGLKDRYAGRAGELLSPWLGEDASLFKPLARWRELIGSGDRISSVEVWEMDCFDGAWSDWLAVGNRFAQGDRRYFESVIRPYTCLAGICVRVD